MITLIIKQQGQYLNPELVLLTINYPKKPPHINKTISFKSLKTMIRWGGQLAQVVTAQCSNTKGTGSIPTWVTEMRPPQLD